MWVLNKSRRFLTPVKNLYVYNKKISYNSSNNFNVSEEVRYAIKNNKPVVALESTIITHGMPYPDNIKCAIEVEKIVRQQGAVPATIAILGGKITVGLNEGQLVELAEAKDVIKTSRRDLPYVVGHNKNGGTTVSATILISGKVGIPIFVTGGIGGVHRQGETTLDISADLTELGKNGVAVISSGVKSILDIPKTLEYLETQGVFVATFGDSTDFPAFYCRSSGHQAPYKVSSAVDAARVINSSLSLQTNSGMLFAVPIPEKYALDDRMMEETINKALVLAKERNIRGKEITPFLLDMIKVMTDGKSLEANMALIKNNAKIGANIAVELACIRQHKTKVDGGYYPISAIYS